MAENNNTTPQLNLEQILQTLANLPPIPQVSQQEPLQPYDPLSIPVHKRNTQEPYSSIPPAIPAPAGYNQHAQLDPRLIGRSLPQYHQADSKPVPQRSSTPTIDPSTIIEWKHALRCVNKMAAQSPTFEPTIQKMIKSQEQNTKDWENGRQRLIEEQNAKRENEKTQRAALSIPGLLENAPLLRTPERDAQELKNYHQKVYRACRLMTDSHSAELKRLGVPFFGVRPDLIQPDDHASSSVDEADPQPEDATVGKITKKQLLTLQRKMLNHLVELYGD